MKKIMAVLLTVVMCLLTVMPAVTAVDGAETEEIYPLVVVPG